MILVDGDRHGEDYITPMQIGFYFYQSSIFLTKSTPHYMILQELIGQLNNHKMNHLHNLQTITMGVI